MGEVSEYKYGLKRKEEELFPMGSVGDFRADVIRGLVTKSRDITSGGGDSKGQGDQGDGMHYSLYSGPVSLDLCVPASRFLWTIQQNSELQLHAINHIPKPRISSRPIQESGDLI